MRLSTKSIGELRANSVVAESLGAYFDSKRAAPWAAGRGIETQRAAAIAGGRRLDAGVVLVGRNRLDIEMLPYIAVLVGGGYRVRSCAALQVAQVQITELVEANAFGAPTQHATQLMERETATITDGELIRAVQARRRILDPMRFRLGVGTDKFPSSAADIRRVVQHQ